MRAYALGLMSGTSCDGVSLALCSFKNKSFKIHAYQEFPYSRRLRELLLNAVDLKTPALSKLNAEIGIHYADCAESFLKKIRLRPNQLAVIGSHGQTVYHGPSDQPLNTFQIGEPSYLAERLKVPVVSDFRPRDIAAGGSGAPLIPFFDRYFFSDGKDIALQNIGGIGNVTFLGKNGLLSAFDTGPGNCLIDLAVSKATKGKQSFDKNGKIAASGWIDQKAVQKMIRHPFFRQKPPKSTGRELFNQRFIDLYLKNHSAKDTIATLTFFTAFSVAENYRRFLPARPSKIIVSGGGSKNATLLKHLKQLLAPSAVSSIEQLGISTQSKEPAAFAFFAWLAIQNKINHEPRGTGAKHACVLGKITC